MKGYTAISVDGVTAIVEENFIETNNGVIVSHDVMFSYLGQSMSLTIGSKPVEAYFDCLYAVVLRERAHGTHYRLVSVRDGKLCYKGQKDAWCTLKEALDWKGRFLGMDKSLSAIRREYDLHAIMPYNDTTLDWFASYMPNKRTRIDAPTREEVYAMCGGHCAYCGKPIAIAEMQVDHVESHYRHQGKDEIANYLPACRDCNGLKSDFTLEEFRNVLIPNCAKGGKICGDNRKSRICKAYGLRMNPHKKIVFYFEKERTDEGTLQEQKDVR